MAQCHMARSAFMFPFKQIQWFAQSKMVFANALKKVEVDDCE